MLHTIQTLKHFLTHLPNTNRVKACVQWQHIQFTFNFQVQSNTLNYTSLHTLVISLVKGSNLRFFYISTLSSYEHHESIQIVNLQKQWDFSLERSHPSSEKMTNFLLNLSGQTSKCMWNHSLYSGRKKSSSLMHMKDFCNAAAPTGRDLCIPLSADYSTLCV